MSAKRWRVSRTAVGKRRRREPEADGSSARA